MVYIDLGRFWGIDRFIYHLTQDIDQEFGNFGNFDFSRVVELLKSVEVPSPRIPRPRIGSQMEVNWIVVPHSVYDEDHHTRRFIHYQSICLTKPR